MGKKTIRLFLRFAISIGFLSAVADRFGMWAKETSAWGNWDNFLDYTQLINPWIPNALIPTIGIMATVAEIVFAIFLIIGFKTELFAKLSGFLLLIFALSMTFSIGIKGVFDYSVFIASAAAFALSFMKKNYLEPDNLQYIGTIHSEIKRLENCPLLENENAPEATVEIYTEFLEGIKNIESGSEIILFTWLHKADRAVLQTKPRNNPNSLLSGVFSTRSPDRPNPIGIHFVRVISVSQDNKLIVVGLEVLDQTPIIDIKPDLKGTIQLPDRKERTPNNV